MTTRFEAPGALLGAPRRLRYLAPALLSAYATWLALGPGWDAHLIAMMVQVLALVLAGVFAVQRKRPRERIVVRIDEQGALHLGAHQFAAAGDIRGMLVTAHHDKIGVTLERADGERADLELDQPGHLAELRASLQAGSQLASQTFRGHVPFNGVSALLVILLSMFSSIYALTALLKTHFALAAWVVPLLLVGIPLGVSWMRAIRVVVGAEGVRVTRRLRFGAKLLPYRTLGSEPGWSATVLWLLVEKTRALGIELGNSHEARTLAASIRHHVEHLAEPGEETVEAQLARGGATPREWLAALAQRANPADQSYRLARLPSDELWSVLENPEADPSARIGAAVTLRLQEPLAESRERLRIAVRATALPEVSAAVEALADHDDVDESLSRVARTLR